MTRRSPRGVSLPMGLVAEAMEFCASQDWRGLCYEAAINGYPFVARYLGQNNVRLVHGTPIGKDSNGARIGHAWIECQCEGVEIVFDFTFAPIPLELGNYYRQGRLNEPDAVIVRYDRAAILDVLAAEGEKGETDSEGRIIASLGPWDPRVAAALHNPEKVTK